MMNTRNVSYSTWSIGKKYLSDSEMIDLISLISQYVPFCFNE